MARFVYPSAAQLAQVTLLVPPYNACVVHLLKGPVTLGPILSLADCAAQEADFTGYASVTEPASNPVPYPDPVRQGVSFGLPTSTFTVGATPTVGNDIYGFYVESAASKLLVAVLFTTPYPMHNAADAINLEMTANNFGTDDVSCTVNGVPQ